MQMIRFEPQTQQNISTSLDAMIKHMDIGVERMQSFHLKHIRWVMDDSQINQIMDDGDSVQNVLILTKHTQLMIYFLRPHPTHVLFLR
jgi:hypothetical protein